MKRWTRWSLWLLAGTGVPLALAVAFVFIAIHHLDAPWLKRPLQRWIWGAAGFEVDWRSVRVDLRSGAHLEGLVVKSPPAFRNWAPDLLRADAVDIDAAPFAGIRAIRITHADVTLVQQGSHGSWERPVKNPAARGEGLSRVLATLFSKPPPIPAASVEGGSIAWISVDPANAMERVRVSGLSLALQGWTLNVGTAPNPVPLDVKYEQRDSVHTAALYVHATGNAGPRSLAASVQMKVAHQDWAPALSVEKLLALHLTAGFDPAHQRIDLDLDHLQLADDAVALKGAAVLPDDPTVFPTVHDMEGVVDLKRLASLVAPLSLPLSVDQGTLHLRAKNTDAIDVDGKLDKIVFARAGARVSLSGTSLTATLRPRGPHFVRAKLNGHCVVAPPGAKPWFNEDVRVDLEADDVARNFSRARLRGKMAGSWGELAVEDDHHADHDAAHITFRLPSLALLAPALAKMPWSVDWGRASATASIAVRAEVGSGPARIHQTSQLGVQNLVARLPAGVLAARSLSAELRSEGTDRDHHTEVGLRMAGLQWRGGAATDQTLDATLDFAAATPRFRFVLKTDGGFAPSASGQVEAHFDPGRRELISELTASASHLSRLAPFLKEVPWLARLDLAKTETTLAARARLRGISRFEPSLLTRARGGRG